MIHVPQLINDLAFILGGAGLTTLIFKWLKQPLILGYILVGLLVSPNFPFLPSIAKVKSIQIWAEIGVIFLLFSLGLEFSFKKLVKVGGTASITAMTEVVGMLLLNYIISQLLGWSFMNSGFLGEILSISSTTIIIRAFDELGVKSQKFAGIVFGILVVEDLVVFEPTAVQDLRDTYLHLENHYEEISDSANNLINTYLSVASQKTNDVMRVLTIFSVFFMPLTFIAGIYGMNFEFMPELKARFGYPVAMVLMGLVTVCIYFWFRRKAWL